MPRSMLEVAQAVDVELERLKLTGKADVQIEEYNDTYECLVWDGEVEDDSNLIAEGYGPTPTEAMEAALNVLRSIP